MPSISDIIFYINLGFGLCVLVELTSTILMTRKTACMYIAGLTSIWLFGIGLAAFVVQFMLYVLANQYYIYAVYAAGAIMYSGFLVASIYRILLGKRSDKALCVFAGIFGIVPPVGTVFCIFLMSHMRFDTRVESIVYNGYAYTFAALETLVGRFRAEFIDGGGEEQYDKLDKKSERALLKKLKKQAKTPENYYRYGEAIINYRPKDFGKGIRMISKAAKQNYPPALFNLGYCYEKGTGVKKDGKRARELYTRAADLGDKDAALRLGIVSIAKGEKTEGASLFADLAAKGDICAKFNLALCYERGDGVEPDFNKAVGMYCECLWLLAAQRRLFSIAASCIKKDEIEKDGSNRERFNTVTKRSYPGGLGLMMQGLAAVYDKRAADAADLFLEAVKKRDKWEGEARCLVGSLYMDCGGKPVDRQHGAAYIRSAFGLTPTAREIFATIPHSLINAKPEKRK